MKVPRSGFFVLQLESEWVAMRCDVGTWALFVTWTRNEITGKQMDWTGEENYKTIQ